MEKRVYIINLEDDDFDITQNKFTEWQKKFFSDLKGRAMEKRIFISKQIDRELYENEIKTL